MAAKVSRGEGLRRSVGAFASLPADQIAALRQAIQSAESSHLNQSELAKLKNLAPSLERAQARQECGRLNSIA